MFDPNDVEQLEARINTIWALGASPEIILMGMERVSIRELSRNMPLDKCTLLILYNQFKNRRWERGIIGLAEVAAAISYSEEDIEKIEEIIANDDYLESLLHTEIRSLVGKDIIVEGETPRLISDYARGLDLGVHSTYTRLRGMMNILGKVISVKAIIGGIFEGLSNRIGREDLIQQIFNLEPPTSPYHLSMAKIDDYIEWYRSKKVETLRIPEGVPTRINEVGFYSESFKRLDKIEMDSRSPIYKGLQIFEPQVKTVKYTIHPPTQINVVDMISNAITSIDLPLIAADIGGTKIIKRHRGRVEPSWFADLTMNTVKIYVRVGRNKHQLILYDVVENYFSLESKSKNIPIDDIISILCSHLDAYWLSNPESYSSTWTAISDPIDVDRNVLAWMITNPPGPYAMSGIGQYIFLEESSKPNSLKEKSNIHMQLGEDKIYISTSVGETTSGTLVPKSSGWIGFERSQQFFTLSINHTPNLAYTKIALNLYKHVMAMYFHYYDEIRREMESMIMAMPLKPPSTKKLVTRVPTKTEEYGYIDPELYKYVPPASEALLPIPIDREEVHIWREKGYSVLRLPTIIHNYPSIEIETSEEIWVRTSRPGNFMVVKKTGDHGYIPVLETGRKVGIVLEIEGDVVTGKVKEVPPSKEILAETSSLFSKEGRLGSVSKSLSLFLAPITNERSIVYRMGTSPSILANLNRVMRTNKTVDDVARYAYMCKGEVWSKSVIEIEDDILSMRIDPLLHFRALEQTFQINLYFLEEDVVEPRLIKPPHAFFYLHRIGNNWPTVIFHKEKDSWPVLIQQNIRTKKISRTFLDAAMYLDKVMDDTNVIHSITPDKGVNDVMEYRTPPYTMNGWVMSGQVVDDYGKVRAVTYKSRDMMGTIFIGFSPIIQPIRNRIIPISNPVMPTGTPFDISRYIHWAKPEYVIRPETGSSFELWKKREKESRVLLAVTTFVYSFSGLSLDEFMDTIDVREVEYNTDMLRNEMPDITTTDIVAYFSRVIPNMIQDGRIVVPSEKVKESLYLYLKANGKKGWTTTFPNYLVYSWDVKSTPDELVFLSQEMALAHNMMEYYPVESDQLVSSPVAYILRQGDYQYIIQMCRDEDQLRYLAYEWLEYGRNMGFMALSDVDDDDLPEVPMVESLVPRVTEISSIIHNDRLFLVIPL